MAISWSNTDPREVTNNFASIIIFTGTEALTGYAVNEDERWHIHTNHENIDYSYIDAYSPWPSHWMWIYTPEKP